MAVTILDKNNFEEEVIKAEGTVLVDFFATWCGPCKMMGPVVEKISSELPDVKVGKLDIDRNPEIAQAYGVMSVPTFMVFSGGKAVNSAVGAIPKESLKQLLGK